MWFLLVAGAHASCLNLSVSPGACVAGDHVQITVDCGGGPLPARWDVALQQDGGGYGALVELGELDDGVAEGVCVDPGLPCDSEQTAVLYAVATDGEGRQEWAYARLVVSAPACASTTAREADDEADLGGPEGDLEDEAVGADEDPEAGGCGASGGGLASMGILGFALRGRRRR